MSLKKQSQFQFQIQAVSVYLEQESIPEKRHFLFAYKLIIKNVGTSPAQLKSRHWIITDGLGHTEEVQGPGVVGLQPRILPQQSFEYESACPLTTSTGSMKGFFHFMSDEGDSFSVEIPEFYLLSKYSVH